MMRTVLPFTALFVLILTSHAYAYIDPGTGSVVTTAIIGFIAAAGYTMRKFFYRLTDMFRSKQSSASDKNRGR